MKILAFVDVHAEKASIKKILKKAQHADILISAGDLSSFQEGFTESLKMLLKAKKPIYILHGNLPHEDQQMVKEAAKLSKLIIPLHKKIIDIGDITLVGFGGGGFSQFEPSMEKFFKSVEKKLATKKNIIFVTHAPPYKTTTDYLYWLEEHVGCQTTVNVIKKIKPLITICGHLHETALLEDTIGHAPVINVGQDGIILEL